MDFKRLAFFTALYLFYSLLEKNESEILYDKINIISKEKDIEFNYFDHRYNFVILDKLHNKKLQNNNSRTVYLIPLYNSINLNGKLVINNRTKYDDNVSIIVFTKNGIYFEKIFSEFAYLNDNHMTDLFLKMLTYYFGNDNIREDNVFIYYEKYEMFKDFIMFCLKVLINHFNVTFVLGAGVSCEYGSMSWDSLVSKLTVDVTKMCNKPEVVLREVGACNNSSVQVAKLSVSGHKYYQTIKNSIYTSSSFVSKPNSTINSIIKCIKNSDKQTNIITYNYDDYFERELDLISEKYNLVYNEFPVIYKERKFNMYHVHGFLPHNYKPFIKNRGSYEKSIVLSENEYYNLYNETYKWNVNQQINSFNNDVCLFVGNSIKDDYEKRLLNLAVNPFKFHFMFKKTKYFDNGKEYPFDCTQMLTISRYFFYLGVLIIWVDDFDEIKQIIENLNI